MPMMQNPMGTGAMQAVGGMPGQAGRSPSAVWAVVNPNMPPQMQQQMMQQQMMQHDDAAADADDAADAVGAQQMMPMPPGAAPMPTGMMMAPGMGRA